MTDDVPLAEIYLQEERDLYTTLFHVVAASSPDEDWDHGCMEYEVLGAGVASFRYTTFKGGVQRFGFAPGSAQQDAGRVFVELARRMEAAGHPAWNAARFETTREGKMKMHFSYSGEIEPQAE